MEVTSARPKTALSLLHEATTGILLAMLFFYWSGLSSIRASSSGPERTASNSSALEVAFTKFDAAAQMDSSAKLLDVAEKAARTAPREGFDVKVKAAQIGKDVDRIFAF